MLKIIDLIAYLIVIILSISTLSEQRKLRNKIVGGSGTTIEEFPYQVALEYDRKLICGGTIITPLHILTAAHCTDDVNLQRLMVRAGSSTLTSGGVLQNVNKIIHHDNYNLNTSDYDAAILVLSGPLNYTSKIQAIKLPEANETIQNGQIGIVTGWGHVKEEGPKSHTLQKVAVPVIPQGKCVAAYKNDFQITKQMFCAGYLNMGGRDACQGDSGGPFNFNHKLMGITSWGVGCAEKNYPGVYVLVPTVRNWIRQQIGQ